jgi:hypothetical protein
MDAPIKGHLTWDPDRALEAREAVRDLKEHPGFEFLREAFEQRVTKLTKVLVNTDPTDEGSQYAAALAEIRAYQEFDRIVEGIEEYGSEAVYLMRPDLQPVA